MPDKFDPYREALIVEEKTVWPEEFDELEPELRRRVEQQSESPWLRIGEANASCAIHEAVAALSAMRPEGSV